MTQELSPEQNLQQLQDREREIIKKMNIAMRAQANPQIIAHFDFMLQEIRFAQQEWRAKQQNSGQKDGFDDFLSIG